MLNKRSKYFLSLVFRVKKKRRRSRLTPEPGMRRAWLMKWDYTHRLSLSSSRPPCVSGAMKTAPEMLSMLISRGDDRRGWMFSSCTFIGWLGWCLSERQALRLAAKFGHIQKHGSRCRHSFPVTEERKKCQTQRTDRFPPNPSFRRVFQAPTALPESDTTPRETCELTNYSRDPTQMFNEEIWRLRTESWTTLSFVIFYLSYCYSLQEVFNSSYSEFFFFFFPLYSQHTLMMKYPSLGFHLVFQD